MKSPDRSTVLQLESLPNIGPAMAADLRAVGILTPQDLREKNAWQLYAELCAVTGRVHDPCVVDVFLSVIDFMEGGEAKPWCKYTAVRKRMTAGSLVPPRSALRGI